MPLDGSGDRGLFVVDADDESIEGYSFHEYFFNLNSNTGLEFRATLAWIDPPATEYSSTQLIHDLDLAVVSPSGTWHRMWSFGEDNRNVVERVIVSADDVDADNDGAWTVAVSSASITTTNQPYSLVVTGAIRKGSGGKTSRSPSAAGCIASAYGFAHVLSIAAAVAASLFFGV